MLYLIVLNAICLSVTSKDNVLNFLKELVVEIDMVSLVLVEHFATHDPKKAGMFFQMIETSNISGPCDINGDGYIDVFSL